MDAEKELNLTLPIILIGLLGVGVFVYFVVSPNFSKDAAIEQSEEVTAETEEVSELAKRNLAGVATYFDAPNKVKKGEKALFLWKTGIVGDTVCEGNTEPEGSDGGWSGPKDTEGSQEVGPIDINTAYFLDCVGDESQKREVELISVIAPVEL